MQVEGTHATVTDEVINSTGPSGQIMGLDGTSWVCWAACKRKEFDTYLHC